MSEPEQETFNKRKKVAKDEAFMAAFMVGVVIIVIQCLMFSEIDRSYKRFIDGFLGGVCGAFYSLMIALPFILITFVIAYFVILYIVPFIKRMHFIPFFTMYILFCIMVMSTIENREDKQSKSVALEKSFNGVWYIKPEYFHFTHVTDINTYMKIVNAYDISFKEDGTWQERGIQVPFIGKKKRQGYYSFDNELLVLGFNDDKFSDLSINCKVNKIDKITSKYSIECNSSNSKTNKTTKFFLKPQSFSFTKSFLKFYPYDFNNDKV